MKIYEHDYTTFKCKYLNIMGGDICGRCKYCTNIEIQLEDYKGGGMIKVAHVDCLKEKLEKMQEILK